MSLIVSSIFDKFEKKKSFVAKTEYGRNQMSKCIKMVKYCIKCGNNMGKAMELGTNYTQN